MFRYHPSLLERFPTIRAGVVHAVGVENPPTRPGLLDEYHAAQAARAESLAHGSPADLPSIAAWRRAFAEFGVKPTQYRNAAEALLRRLGKQGDIPSINTLVDLGNLVSIRYAMPVAVLDRAGIDSGITVRFATGEEPFTDLGSSETARPDPGEVVFVDESGRAHARRWCWRQSAESAAGPSTTEVIIVMEGHHDAASDDVVAGLQVIGDLFARHLPAAGVETFRLDPDHPGV